MKKYLFFIIILLVAVIIAWWLGFNKSISVPNRQVESSVLLEKIKMVTKLVSVEGQFSEIIEKKEWYNYDIFNLFSKKILVRVKAKVAVGYNFENLKITVDSLQHTVTLHEFPAPEILYIDHDIDYYDIQEGTFNSFSVDEYNTLLKDAKNLILKKTQESNLLQQAESQKQVYVDMLDMALKSMGWKFIVQVNRSHHE